MLIMEKSLAGEVRGRRSRVPERGSRGTFQGSPSSAQDFFNRTLAGLLLLLNPWEEFGNQSGLGQLQLPVTGAGYGEEPNQALLLTVQEAAKLMRIGRDMAYVLVAEDRIPPVRLGRHIRIGLPCIRLHSLRHNHATFALAVGIHPKVVSERLGHSTVAFTMDVYSHAIPSMEAEAAEAIANLVRGTKPAQGGGSG